MRKLTQERSKNIFTGEKDRSCFIDTGVFFAAYSTRDAMHVDARALLISSILGWFGKAYTSTYVLDEVLTLTKAKVGGEKAVMLSDGISQSKKISVLDVEDKEGKTLKDSIAKFKKYYGVRGLSFTDCTTLSIQERMKIGSMLSFDRNFLPFVPRLFGEGYCAGLTEDETEVLRKTAEKLGIDK